MKKKKDPRLADITSGSNAAPDMPIAKPAAPVKKKSMQERLAERKQAKAAVQPIPIKPIAPTTIEEDDLPPAVRRRRRLRWANRPEWLTTLLTALAVGLFAYLIYFGINTFDETLRRNQRQDVIANVWQRLLENDVTVKGTPDSLDASGEPVFSHLAFEAIRDRQRINQNLRLASTLPGITEIRVSPPAANDAIAQGQADISTLSIIADNYPNITSLDLSSTRISDLEKIYQLPLTKLFIVNTPIRREKLGSLEAFKSVTDLGIGWTHETRDPDHKVFLTDSYRARVIDAVAKLKGLQNLYTLEFNLTPEEKQRLPSGINIVELN